MPGVISENNYLDPDTPLRPRGGVQSPKHGHILPPRTQPIEDPNIPEPVAPAAPVRVAQQRTRQGLGSVGTHRAGAAQQTVEDNQLMSYQLNSLLEQGGQYLDRARQQGVDRAEQRGLGNSSIAGGNAVGAAIDRAMPIAAFDAGRYGEVGNLNQQATNVMANANADRALRGRMFDQEFRLNNRALDSQNYNNQFNGFMNNISAIYNNPNMSAEDQTAAVENLRQMYPGFANDAWQQMPEGILSPGAIPSAQMMPPMPPIVPGINP